MYSRPVFILTGRPGVGKSTLFNKIIDYLKLNGIIIGGLRTPEIRVHGRREGFKIIDILTGNTAWLAKKDGCSGGYRVGSYNICIDEASTIVKGVIENGIEKSEVIGIDEIGPMELKLDIFKELLRSIRTSPKPLILVIHNRLNAAQLGIKGKTEKHVVTPYNRDWLAKVLPGRILVEVKTYLGK